MQASKKDIGYTIYARLEESFRFWLSDKLLKLYGNEWKSYIPDGIFKKFQDRSSNMSAEDIDEPSILLEETDVTDLKEIICYRKAFSDFIYQEETTIQDFQNKVDKLYEIRCKIAHIKHNFSAFDLDLLIEIATFLAPIFDPFSNELKEVILCIKTNPGKVVITIPSSFIIYDDQSPYAYMTNLPPGDYDPEGGFIGRKEDLSRLGKLVLGDLYRVVTISGAGGVGKTALAHQFCQSLLNKTEIPFEGIVWVSAKEEKLTVTGIESIEPTLKNYEGLLDNILETFQWTDKLNDPIEKKEENVDVILRAYSNGILLVVDNLETIQDERVKEFIKEFPPPSKVLITSRLGLGEVEKRYVLKEMSSKDAVTLLRTVAREKNVESLVKLPENTLSNYVDKMSRYPLVIKWVVGHVAIGKDINHVIQGLAYSESDVVKFCFDRIFDSSLSEDSRIVLYALAAYEKPSTRGILSHVSELSPEKLDNALSELIIASFVIQSSHESSEGVIETRYELLPLTRNFIHSKLRSHPEIFRNIRNRMEIVQNLIEEADRAGKQYRYSLRDMGAETEEEKIAATLSITAYNKYQLGDYDGAVEMFNRASQIAPNFPAIYRNWATMESEADFPEKADELMRKATQLRSDDPRIWFVWGNIEKKRGRCDRAYDYLSKALELSPDDAPILGALGEVEKRRGNFENADKLLKKGLEVALSDIARRRHEIICYTSLADNSRRYAEELRRNKRNDESLSKLQEAYKYALKAVELGKDDRRAQDTFREVSLDLAHQLTHSEGYNIAKPYFENAIVQNPGRAKEKRTTQRACYQVACILIENENFDEARKYYNMGRKTLSEGSEYIGRYRDLAMDLSQKRSNGKLIYVSDKGDWGKLLSEHDTELFLHITDILPKEANDDLKNMVGSTFSFIVAKTNKGLAAKRARLVKDKKSQDVFPLSQE